MGHIVLPRTMDLQNASEKPGYYALTGVPFLINKICTEYKCSISELEVSLFGGANSIREKDSFQIGKRNAEEVLKMLKILNIKPVSTEIGGYSSRTIEMDILSGNVKVIKQPIRF
ncbi:chemotaxis protein CheD [Bacillus sp. T3]|uniref:chemotaxis protein CheD n=1 Tax=Bacillus sp. T3 TaxID=467262 RepID=UPI002980AF5C|nr:chemotaxis protein CheD [Bacillus sp. T3]